MTIAKSRRLATTLAVTALAAAAAALGTGPVRAQAHDHDHGTAAPGALSLDHGRKWPTDAPLREGMSRIRAMVQPQLAAAHAGRLGPREYAALAGRIEAEVGRIVAQCKLEPKADAMLHVVIGEIGGGVDAMAGKAAGQAPAQGLVQVAHALDAYAGHFDHPGFEPVAPRH